MIEDGFDARTLANMNAALERVCQRRPARITRFAGAWLSGSYSALKRVRKLWVHLQKPVNVFSGDGGK
jgi:hypothetical protein